MATYSISAVDRRGRDTATCNAVGREAIEGLRLLASLPRAGAGREKTQPFNWIHSRLFTALNPPLLCYHSTAAFARERERESVAATTKLFDEDPISEAEATREGRREKFLVLFYIA